MIVNEIQPRKMLRKRIKLVSILGEVYFIGGIDPIKNHLSLTAIYIHINQISAPKNSQKTGIYTQKVELFPLI
jgi:hypothetical protein